MNARGVVDGIPREARERERSATHPRERQLHVRDLRRAHDRGDLVRERHEAQLRERRGLLERRDERDAPVAQRTHERFLAERLVRAREEVGQRGVRGRGRGG